MKVQGCRTEHIKTSRGPSCRMFASNLYACKVLFNNCRWIQDQPSKMKSICPGEPASISVELDCFLLGNKRRGVLAGVSLRFLQDTFHAESCWNPADSQFGSGSSSFVSFCHQQKYSAQPFTDAQVSHVPSSPSKLLNTSDTFGQQLFIEPPMTQSYYT